MACSRLAFGRPATGLFFIRDDNVLGRPALHSNVLTKHSGLNIFVAARRLLQISVYS